MANDAMDWHPTTPPAAHNPYCNSQYMPGGWPESPPLYRYTSGVFSRKRRAVRYETATKKLCTGIRKIGSYAAIPVKPVYAIVRSVNRTIRDAKRRSIRESAHTGSLPPATRRPGAAADSGVTAQAAQTHSQLFSEPTVTTPYKVLKDGTVAVRNHIKDNFQSPAATSVTDTETTIASPASERFTSRRGGGSVRTDTNRHLREQPQNTERAKLYSSLSSYLAAQNTDYLPRAQPDAAARSTEMNGPNRFDADYKRSPIAYGARGATARVRVRPIGTRSKKKDGLNALFGGFEFEKPIEADPPEQLDPRQQIRTELESFNADQPEDSGFKPQQADSREPIDITEAHDERWSSGPVPEHFFPDQLFESVPATNGLDAKDSTSQQPLDTDDAGDSNNLFSERNTFHSPPPIKLRPATWSKWFTSKTKDKIVTQSSALHVAHEAVPASKGTDTVTIDNRINTDEHNSTPDDTTVDPSLQASGVSQTDVGVDSSDTKLEAPPVTPMKTLAKKPVEKKVHKTDEKQTVDALETPAEKLARLNISGSGDNDTPKATPHTGQKTTRITRYREAIEKAQQAKLQQYELVPISSEWDKKVRNAVKSGIPDYLGPHDLARVVPQYASRGQDNWLNDETINKYLEIVAAHGRKDDRQDQVRSHHTFNNFFYNNLKAKGPESVVRWSKRAKIGGKNLAYVEKIFVPINSGAHWTLAVVEPAQKRIIHYNSMRGTATGMQACEDLKRWVAVEQGKDFKEDEWTLIAVGESPQQTNSDDCGVFTITSARQIMLGYTPMSYGSAQIPDQRVRIVAELINQGLLKSTSEE